MLHKFLRMDSPAKTLTSLDDIKLQWSVTKKVTKNVTKVKAHAKKYIFPGFLS